MTTNLNLLTLVDIFGKGATQDATTITIQKNALLRLTPNINNSAESLLAAIIITALTAFSGNLTTNDNQHITTEDNQPLSFDNSDTFELLKMFQWKASQFTRNGQKYINNQVIVESYGAN